MFYEYHLETVWAASWKEVDKLERPTHYHRKTMITVFFNGTGEYFLNILPRSRSVNTSHFAEEIVRRLLDICHPEVRNPHERKITHHFDNTCIRNVRTVMGQLEQSGFTRMEHPVHCSNLARITFSFWSHEETIERKELCRARTAFIGAF
jgi:hypothetical protein